MIGIISYGLGNILSIKNTLDETGNLTTIINNPNEITEKINKIILPGVGSFDNAIDLLEKKKFIDPIKNFVEKKDNYLLGICLGMQILATKSDEGEKNGLNLIPGEVKKFENAKILPHIGWNKVNKIKDSPLFLNIDNGTDFYFLHSYFYKLISNTFEIANSNYFEKFTCAVENQNIFGVQFHPEKSHQSGKIILNNFAKLNEN